MLREVQLVSQATPRPEPAAAAPAAGQRRPVKNLGAGTGNAPAFEFEGGAPPQRLLGSQAPVVTPPKPPQ
eukprot:11212894-Lingulodinium_polyedra.AAC.1